MSKIYKTARGKSIDIDKIKLANESAVAVGNMKVNARGDLLGSGGQIAVGRNQIMNQVYAVEEAPYSPTDSAPINPVPGIAAIKEQAPSKPPSTKSTGSTRS